MANEKKTEAMSDDELDQIIQDMSQEDEQATAEPPLSIVAAEKSYAAPSSTRGDQSLTMELQGVVNLKVNFSSGGRSIELVCSEEALVCRMADGTEFRIPIGASASKKKAA